MPTAPAAGLPARCAPWRQPPLLSEPRREIGGRPLLWTAARVPPCQADPRRRQQCGADARLMPKGDDLAAILSSALATDTLFSDDFEAFREERALMLAEVAAKLIA
jgi:hypothetical protein